MYFSVQKELGVITTRCNNH